MRRQPGIEVLALLLAAGALVLGFVQTLATLRFARQALRTVERSARAASMPAEAPHTVTAAMPVEVASLVAAASEPPPTPEASSVARDAEGEPSLAEGLAELADARDALAEWMRTDIAPLHWEDAATGGEQGLRVQNIGPSRAFEIMAEVRLDAVAFRRGRLDTLAADNAHGMVSDLEEYTESSEGIPEPARDQVSARVTWMNEDGTVDSTDWALYERR